MLLLLLLFWSVCIEKYAKLTMVYIYLLNFFPSHSMHLVSIVSYTTWASANENRKKKQQTNKQNWAKPEKQEDERKYGFFLIRKVLLCVTRCGDDVGCTNHNFLNIFFFLRPFRWLWLCVWARAPFFGIACAHNMNMHALLVYLFVCIF